MKQQYWIQDSFNRKVFGPFNTYEELQNSLPKTGTYNIAKTFDFGAFRNATFEMNLKSKNGKITGEHKEKSEEEIHIFLGKINEIVSK